MRVVSVGVEVEELLKNVKDPQWRKVSVEFCGGTHVQKTGDIKDLIILEESGIAKGIRRIIAVTGEDAHQVQRVADEFSERLTRIEKMPGGPEKDREVKATQTELNQLSISALTKTTLKERFAKIYKTVLDEQKAQQKLEAKKALDAITEYFSKPENKDKATAILKLPISANTKAVSDALNHLKTKDKGKTVYLLAADSTSDGKVVHGCHVSEVGRVSRPLTV